MFHVRVGLSTVILATLIGVGGTSAQAPAAPPAPSVEPTVAAPAPKPGMQVDVEKWTTEQWEAAKAKWSQEQRKWADCEQSATDQKLTGTKSWAFLYRCMT
jgi:hypothetical protein